MPQIKKFAVAKALKKKSKRAERTQKSKLEKTLELDIVESRDHVEGALATVRPQYTHKIKRSGELLLQKKTPRAPDTPKTTENPLNLLNESRKQMKARTMGKSKGPGPAGPGIARRKKTLVSETDGTKAKLLAKLAAKRAAQ